MYDRLAESELHLEEGVIALRSQSAASGARPRSLLRVFSDVMMLFNPRVRGIICAKDMRDLYHGYAGLYVPWVQGIIPRVRGVVCTKGTRGCTSFVEGRNARTEFDVRDKDVTRDRI